MAGQLFATNSIGGFLSAFNLSKELRDAVEAKSKFRQFSDVKDAFGKVTKTGQTFTWDTMPLLTRASRLLTETNTIPQGQNTVLQGTLTVYERGFSVPYTEFLESLAMISVRGPLMRNLKADAVTDLDATAWTEFNKTPLRMVHTSSADNVSFENATQFTTNSVATATNTVLISKVNVRAVINGMKGRNINPYSENDYYAIARPAGLRLMKDDMDSVHQYVNSGQEMIANGEIGRYDTCRFVEQTTIPAGGAADSTTFSAYTNTADAWGDGTKGDWVFFFGADTVCEAVHTPPEIRAKIPDDYGRSRGIAWYALVGYGITHTDVTQARIVKWDSGV